jgi:hypothetical protein
LKRFEKILKKKNLSPSHLNRAQLALLPLISFSLPRRPTSFFLILPGPPNLLSPCSQAVRRPSFPSRVRACGPTRALAAHRKLHMRPSSPLSPFHHAAQLLPPSLFHSLLDRARTTTLPLPPAPLPCITASAAAGRFSPSPVPPLFNPHL